MDNIRVNEQLHCKVNNFTCNVLADLRQSLVLQETTLLLIDANVDYNRQRLLIVAYCGRLF